MPRTLFRKNLLDGSSIDCLVSEREDGDFSTGQLDKALLEKNITISKVVKKFFILFIIYSRFYLMVIV